MRKGTMNAPCSNSDCLSFYTLVELSRYQTMNSPVILAQVIHLVKINIQQDIK